MATRMQQRRGTAAQWTSADPILSAGEIGFETDTGKFKIGNGSSIWSALNYYVDANSILDGAPGVLDTLNELAAALGDDPAFITTVATNLSNHESDTTNVHGISDTANLVTLAGNQTLTNKTLTSPTLNGSPIANTADPGDSSSRIATTLFVQQALADLINSAPGSLDTLNELAAALGDDPNFATTITNSLATKLNLSGGTMTGVLSLSGNPTESFHASNKSYVDDSIGTHNGDTTSVHGIEDTSALATKTYADNAVSTHSGDTTSVHGIANTADLATKTYANGAASDAVTTHNSVTTSVHGIADTSELATSTDVSNAQTAAQNAAAAALSAHEGDSTNVHGIANTADLATKTYADNSSSTAAGSAQTAAELTASTALTAHNNDTTDVHGIADTTALVLTSDSRLSDTRTPTDNTVSTDKIVNLAVTDAKLAADAVTSAKILDGAVTSAKIADGTIVNADINASAAIAQSKISGLTTDLAAKAPLADPTFTGTVSGITKSMVGLGNVDNTSDANKPVSTATQTALDAKASLSGATFTGAVSGTSLTLSGNLTVNGTTTTVNTTNFTTADPVIYLGEGNNANLVDLGFVASFNDGTYQHTGLIKDTSDSKWKLFKGVTDEPTTTVNFAQGSLDTLAVGALEATTVTPSSGVVFSDGTQTKEGVPSRTPIIQKTAAYTLGALTERDSLIEVSHTGASAVNVTIPADSTLNFPIGTSIDVLQTNTGSVAIAAGAGVTVNATPGLTLRTQWSSATLLKRAANTWVVYGDLK